MPRRKITFENGEFYHIYNRGVDRRNIIGGKKDILRILESLEVFNTTESVGSIYEHSFCERRNNLLGSPASKLVEIVAFNILDNHYHLVLKQLDDGGISKFMHSFGTGYVKHFNEKNDRVGSLFQGAFKAQHIDSEEYLRYVIDYVNLNHFIHGYELLGSPASKWGMRSSLEQYIDPKNEWNNKYFECDTSFILNEYKNPKGYKKTLLGMAKMFKGKKKDLKLITWKPGFQVGEEA